MSLLTMTSITNANGPAILEPTRSAAYSQLGSAAELAKYKKQLAEWVDCPSGKTPIVKAKIAEISDKIHAVKVQITKAEAMRSEVSPYGKLSDAPRSATPTPRLDGLGSHLDVKA